jgi:hypothetical protein
MFESSQLHSVSLQELFFRWLFEILEVCSVSSGGERPPSSQQVLKAQTTPQEISSQIFNTFSGPIWFPYNSYGSLISNKEISWKVWLGEVQTGWRSRQFVEGGGGCTTLIPSLEVYCAAPWHKTCKFLRHILSFDAFQFALYIFVRPK